MGENILYTVLALLAMSIATVVMLKRFRLPPILAYLFVGIAVGPHAIGLVENEESVHLLAEVGVVFLLFSIGLEFSISQLLAMKKAVLGLGGTQVLLTTMAGMGVAHSMGISWEGSIVIGGAIALSSTAIVAKQLTEQLEMQSRHGRLALGTLLFQDLAVVPFLVVIPILAGGEADMTAELLFALAKAIAAFIIMDALGRWALRPVFHTVASTHSSELFTLTVIFVALMAGAITHMLGMSAAMGAFLAGIMLGESEYRHQIEIDVRPFRDVFMALFFITIGIQLNVAMLPIIWPQTLLLLATLVIGKGLLVLFISRIMGYENAVAARTALVLAQGGEFGFALLALALNRELLSAAESQAILAAIIASMIIAPILIRENGNIAKRLYAVTYLKQRQLRAKNIFHASRELDNHVIIIGYGRIGQNLASFLRDEAIEYVGLDLDPVIVREAYETGERVYYSDATHVSMLRAAGIKRARALVITIPDSRTAIRIIEVARSRNPEIPILVRTQDDLHLEDLEYAGASRVVPEQLESSMMMATHMLEMLDIPDDEIQQLVEKTRTDHYHNLRSYFHGEQPETVEDIAPDHYRRHTVVLTAGSQAIGKTIDELGLCKTGVNILSVRRGQIRGDKPVLDMKLIEADALLLEGGTEELEHAERVILRGH
ncbi:MAG: monovalent cation:proton antiporter-2 (CPA2) family protein [Gammaproteobacteria bacterium]|nr:monovalent cation:proton antiporter-2 (CPA2) family protein [Gammaproteobacteria bacterium]